MTDDDQITDIMVIYNTRAQTIYSEYKRQFYFFQLKAEEKRTKREEQRLEQNINQELTDPQLELLRKDIETLKLSMKKQQSGNGKRNNKKNSNQLYNQRSPNPPKRNKNPYNGNSNSNKAPKTSPNNPPKDTRRNRPNPPKNNRRAQSLPPRPDVNFRINQGTDNRKRRKNQDQGNESRRHRRRYTPSTNQSDFQRRNFRNQQN